MTDSGTEHGRLGGIRFFLILPVLALLILSCASIPERAHAQERSPADEFLGVVHALGRMDASVLYINYTMSRVERISDRFTHFHTLSGITEGEREVLGFYINLLRERFAGLIRFASFVRDRSFLVREVPTSPGSVFNGYELMYPRSIKMRMLFDILKEISMHTENLHHIMHAVNGILPPAPPLSTAQNRSLDSMYTRFRSFGEMLKGMSETVRGDLGAGSGG